MKKVYETTRYDQFKLLVGNRPVKASGNKWNRLCESMKKYGQLVPALVDTNYNVLDGQHRLEACKLLGIPFVYSIADLSASAGVIGGINTSKSWGTKDFIRYYASQTDKKSMNYKFLQCLMSEFNELPTSSMLSFALARGDGGGRFQEVVEKGDLVLTQEEYTKIRNCLLELRELGYMEWQRENHVTSRPYWNTIGYAYRHPKVDMDRMIKILYENEKRIPSSARVPDLLKRFSELYNKGLQKQNRIYLDVDYEQGKYKSWSEMEVQA